MKRVFGSVLAILALVGLSACETPVSRPSYPELTFTHLEPIKLDVAEIKVVKAYQPTFDSPHVEKEFPVSPLDSAARWATDRLQAAGSDGVATITISDASAIEEKLEREDGLTGVFTTEQSERYTTTIAMHMRVEDSFGSYGQTTAQVKRSITIPEDASLNEREKTWFELTEKVMADLNKRMSENINAHLDGFVLR